MEGRKREMETVWGKCETAERGGSKKKQSGEMRKDGTYVEKVGWNMKMNRARKKRENEAYRAKDRDGKDRREKTGGKKSKNKVK